ncbi:hypothetical protein FRB94_007167 [Tulasnella sp. JGI-2019a]|nr:hypothetical protein FRB94_007167 [Tulasnella sp. JGI-2019a]
MDPDRDTSIAEPAVFTGGTLADCQDFILSIRAYARAFGYLRDPAWIVDYVSCRLNGEAQQWHIRLPPEVAEDWDKLQMALIDHYSHLDSQRGPNSNALAHIPHPPHHLADAMIQPAISNGSHLGVIEINSGALSGVRYLQTNYGCNNGALTKHQFDPILRYLPPYDVGPHDLEFAVRYATIDTCL